QDIGRLRSRRPSLNLIADERGKLLRRSDARLETELLHGGLRLGCRQACVDLTIEPIHDVRRRSCGSPKSDPISPRQLRESDCAVVGTSGRSGLRASLVTARARTFPSRMSGRRFDSVPKLMSMRPPSMSGTACVPLL